MATYEKPVKYWDILINGEILAGSEQTLYELEEEGNLHLSSNTIVPFHSIITATATEATKTMEKGDPYGCEDSPEPERWETLYEATFTATSVWRVEELIIDPNNAPETVKVIFDGVPYIVDKTTYDDKLCYGDYNGSADYTRYPFCVTITASSNMSRIYVQTSGEHTITIQKPIEE